MVINSSVSNSHFVVLNVVLLVYFITPEEIVTLRVLAVLNVLMRVDRDCWGRKGEASLNGFITEVVPQRFPQIDTRRAAGRVLSSSFGPTGLPGWEE